MIRKIKKILYATDLSVNAVSAFALVSELAAAHDAKIVILHAIEALPGITRAYPELASEKTYYEKLKKESQEEIRNRIENQCHKIEELIDRECLSLVTKVLTPIGNPVEEILLNADEEECDLIVMGTHGKGFLTHTFLGSVSRVVLQKTRKPVLVVPLPSEKARAALQGI